LSCPSLVRSNRGAKVAVRHVLGAAGEVLSAGLMGVTGQVRGLIPMAVIG
jgi:hypothetical protein